MAVNGKEASKEAVAEAVAASGAEAAMSNGDERSPTAAFEQAVGTGAIDYQQVPMVFRPPPGLMPSPKNSDSGAQEAVPTTMTAAGTAALWLDGPAEQREEEPARSAAPDAHPEERAAAGTTAGVGAGAGAAAVEGAAQGDELSQLPCFHRSLLRRSYVDPDSGFTTRYHVGRLKSYSQKTGYGFLECSKVRKELGSDVFIHKLLLPLPWKLGQYCEFAIVPNDRGQPQASDVLWLPLINVPKAATAEGAARGLGAARDDVAGPALDSEPPRQGAPLNDVRYLGVLKSFSPAQGYGFISSKEVVEKVGRDIYFDHSQLPRDQWVLGQVVEFSLAFNAKGQPQARRMDWDPVPTLSEGRTPEVRHPGVEDLAKLTVLLQRISDGDPTAAVLTAVNAANTAHAAVTSGSAGAAGGASSANIDYVAFVLDRLPSPEAAVLALDDRMRLLLLLLVSRSLRQPGRWRLVAWFDVLVRAIDPHATQHFHTTVQEIVRHSGPEAVNQSTDSAGAREAYRASLKMLQAKSRALAAAGTRSTGGTASPKADAVIAAPLGSTAIAAQ